MGQARGDSVWLSEVDLRSAWERHSSRRILDKCTWGSEMVNLKRVRLVVLVLGTGALLAGCVGGSEVPSASMPTYESLDAVYADVDDFLDCDADRDAEPIVDRSSGGPMAEYAVCSDLLQIVWFENGADRVSGSQIYADGQDPIYVVEGENWLVLDLAEAVGQERSEKDLDGLATQLGANYRTLNP